jgi:ferredoxin--NADP+ reductase
MGNVAADIMRWLLEDGRSRETEEVIVLARRGPLEAKFDEEEIEYVANHIDRGEFSTELDRVRSQCEACEQDISLESLADGPFPFLATEAQATVWPRLSFRFLTSLKEIVPGSDGRVRRIVVTENDLVQRPDGNTSAKASSRTANIKVDTIIFAIGDSQDPTVGLPMGPRGYATVPNEDPDQPVYEAWDPAAKTPLPGIYLAGWARQPSTGLVGTAQRDGRKAADRILAYLAQLPEKPALSPERVKSFLAKRGIRVVTNEDVRLLSQAESHEAQIRDLEHFKYSDDADMFKAIELEAAHAAESKEMLVS